MDALLVGAAILAVAGLAQAIPDLRRIPRGSERAFLKTSILLLVGLCLIPVGVYIPSLTLKAIAISASVACSAVAAVRSGRAIKKRRSELLQTAADVDHRGGPVPVLARALADPDPFVRGHAAWALGRVGGTAAREVLSGAASSEEDAWVSVELEDATSKAG